mmetsp:Transcript_57421/g.159822  ORF Transcript_57421/g.159822 Transcript_57421/m.159822 type:complete len:241 (+) Transcript_57421:84-806(+)
MASVRLVSCALNFCAFLVKVHVVDAGVAPPLLGECKIVWCSHFQKYFLPYWSSFHNDGHYTWDVSFKTRKGAEHGAGANLTDLSWTVRPDGSWEVSYSQANWYAPDNLTLCCCEYIGSSGPDQPSVLSDYCTPSALSSSRPSLAEFLELCPQRLRTRCPADNATALKMFGEPYVEVYEGCKPFHLTAAAVLPQLPEFSWVPALLSAAGAVLLISALPTFVLCRLARHADRDRDYVMHVEA